jgi:hypothetical protein
MFGRKFEDTKSEAVNGRRISNTIAERKRTKRQRIIEKSLHRKLKSNTNIIKTGDNPEAPAG